MNSFGVIYLLFATFRSKDGVPSRLHDNFSFMAWYLLNAINVFIAMSLLYSVLMVCELVPCLEFNFNCCTY